jgi:hypothetical protein
MQHVRLTERMGRAVHFVVMGCGAASFACVLVLFFFTASDPGLAIYTATPFTDWGALGDTLQASGNVSCVPATDWPRNASTLQALLETAWCTEGVWPPGSNPTNRSAACACVTAAWDGLVRAACGPMNRSVVRPSPEALSGARGQVLGCMALPPQYRVGQLGDLLSSVRPTGLAMYCNAVLCLACASFVLFFFFGFTTFWIWVWMSMVFAVLSVMLVQQVIAQLLVLPSLFLAFVSVVLGLDDEREAGQGSDVTDITDELEICSYCILPQLLPAYAVLMAVSGVGREVGACATFAALGLFMGVSLQVSLSLSLSLPCLDDLACIVFLSG